MNLRERFATAFPRNLLATVAKALVIALAGSLPFAFGWIALSARTPSGTVIALAGLGALVGTAGIAVGYTQIRLYRPVLAALFTVAIMLTGSLVYGLTEGVAAIDWTGFVGLAGYAAAVYAMTQGDRQVAPARTTVADITGRWNTPTQ